MWYIFVFPQEGRATVNQDTRLDNRVIDLRVSCFPELRDKQECICVLSVYHNIFILQMTIKGGVDILKYEK